MTTDTKRMIERIPLEVLNKGNFELLNELVATDFVEHSPQPGVPPTREGFKQTLVGLKTAFPDLLYTIDDSIEPVDPAITAPTMWLLSTIEATRARGSRSRS